MTQASEVIAKQPWAANGTFDSLPLPDYLTISRGQRFSGLQLLQYPRLDRFVRDNAKHFRHVLGGDWVWYSGPDAVIP